MTTPSEDRLLKIFDQYNADSSEGSETLDKSEAIAALLTLFPNEKAAKIVRRINALDRNSDGELTKEEFLAVGSKFYFTYEERILAFGAKYRSGLNKTDAELLDVLQEWKGDEEELMDRMIDEYGPEPEKDEVEGGVSAQPKPEQQESSQISRSSSYCVVPANQTGARGSVTAEDENIRMVRRNSEEEEDSEVRRRREADAAAAASNARSRSRSASNTPPRHYNRQKRTGRNYFGFKKRY